MQYGGIILIVRIADDFDLDMIAESGQCFRWEKKDQLVYRIIAGDRCLYLSTVDNDGDSASECFELDCTPEEFDGFWREYFDLDENYAAIRGRIDPKEDPFLFRAAEHEKGIRILRQDPWEMLVSFIISQNKNIPAIRRSIELLAKACGEPKYDQRGELFYTFPTPEALAELGEDELRGCSLGYRCRYVHAAADAVLNGVIDLDSLKEADEEHTIRFLCGLYGVGVKVANCVSLFGLHHIDAFPVDVWVKRILANEYPDGYPYERYRPYNGVYQQYMFAYYRNLSGGVNGRAEDMGAETAPAEV